jgi:hypothetical protein
MLRTQPPPVHDKHGVHPAHVDGPTVDHQCHKPPGDTEYGEADNNDNAYSSLGVRQAFANHGITDEVGDADPRRADTEDDYTPFGR